MKKAVIFLSTAILILCTACSPDNESSVTGTEDTSSPQIAYTDEWPDNQNTEGVPVPSEGSIVQVISPSDGRYCSVTFEEVSENAFNDYLICLENAGFSLLENISEDISGEGDLSIGTTYSNGKIGVSVAYYDGILSLYMSAS